MALSASRFRELQEQLKQFFTSKPCPFSEKMLTLMSTVLEFFQQEDFHEYKVKYRASKKDLDKLI